MKRFRICFNGKSAVITEKVITWFDGTNIPCNKPTFDYLLYVASENEASEIYEL